jgi:hypothetical protein
MPTAYTDMIDTNPKLSTKKWMIEGLARNFGVLMTLREESYDMTEEQILKALEEDFSVNWHARELAEANTEIIRLSKLNDDDWAMEWELYKNNIQISNAKNIEQVTKKQERDFKVIAELQKVVDAKDISDFTRSVAKFGLDQIELCKTEREVYQQEVLPPKKLKASKLANARRDIKYHTTELAEAKQRARDRINFYKQLRKDLDKVFPETDKT